jgi:hypothetical protein
MFDINIEDAVGPTLARLGGALKVRRPLLIELGKAVAEVLRDHFLARAGEPNRCRWPSQGFWRAVRTRTRLAGADDSRAVVSVADPAFGHKVRGGTVRPRTAKNLAIPLVAAAYGKSPRGAQIPGLRYIPIGGRKFLGARDSASGALTLYYVLKPSVHHPPDPHALPNSRAVSEAVEAAARDFAERLLK